jgi:hypothetical protein
MPVGTLTPGTTGKITLEGIFLENAGWTRRRVHVDRELRAITRSQIRV